MSTEKKQDPLRKVKEQLKTQFNKAFVDLMESNLKSDKPDWEWISRLYKEIRDKICNLTPNRKDRIKEIHEKMDVDIFYQMVSNNAFNGRSLSALVEYVFKHIRELEAPAKNVVTDEKLENLKKVLTHKDTTLGSFIPLFIVTANEKLDDIYNDKEIFMKILKEQMKK
jgi:4-hydroxy-3-methylbut-2-enyl diphosphate reductase IspH